MQYLVYSQVKEMWATIRKGIFREYVPLYKLDLFSFESITIRVSIKLTVALALGLISYNNDNNMIFWGRHAFCSARHWELL